MNLHGSSGRTTNVSTTAQGEPKKYGGGGEKTYAKRGGIGAEPKIKKRHKNKKRTLSAGDDKEKAKGEKKHIGQ